MTATGEPTASADTASPGSGPGLTRAIGRFALVGLVLNSVIGSSVFGLPSVLGAQLGARSPLAWIIAALGMALVVACFAEVSSRFRNAGGAYLYARVAFGRLAGIEMAWLTYLVRLTAAATNANLFVIYLAQFWPAAKGPVAAPVILALLFLPLAVANYRGVQSGIGVSNGFIIAKLIPLAVFLVAGVAFVLTHPSALAVAPTASGSGTWLHAILLLVFAYGGFEAALIPLGEAKNPQRDAPVALFAMLGICALIYTLVQLIVVQVLADPGANDRPVAAAAEVLLGPAGGVLLAAGALVSVYGYLAGAMLNVPRLTYAMAEQGDLAARFAQVHPRFRTPHTSIVLFAFVTWLFAASGSFLQNLTLSAVSRLITYAAVCIALIVFRQRDKNQKGQGESPWFRVPGGEVVALLGVAFAAVLALRMSARELAVLGVTLAVGVAHWGLVRGRHPERSEGTEAK